MEKQFVVIHNAIMERMESDSFACKAYAVKYNYREGELGLLHPEIIKAVKKEDVIPILLYDRNLFSDYSMALLKNDEFMKLKSDGLDGIIEEIKKIYGEKISQEDIEIAAVRYYPLKTFDFSKTGIDKIAGNIFSREISKEDIQKQEEYLKKSQESEHKRKQDEGFLSNQIVGSELKYPFG